MLYENLEEVKDWLTSLDGPGVLVLGQPLLKTDTTETLTDKIYSRFDKDLADFGQYAELRESILCCSHSVVVLTGDVHFARVARQLPDTNGITKFAEVISSPMSLVPGLLGGTENNNCEAALPLDSHPIESMDPFRGQKPRNHFVTVQFSSLVDDKVRMKVCYWPILRFDQDPAPEPLGNYEFTLA